MTIESCRLCVVCAVATAMVAAVLAMAGPPAARAADPVSFINDVAPILKEHCYACHDARKKAGKLAMTSYAALRAGGINDDPVTPGEPESSELVTLLTAEGARAMPPRDKGGPLPPEKVRVIERWVAEGAKLDAGIDPQADLLRELRKRWQPPTPSEAYPAAVTVNALTFSPDGRRLVVGGYYELTVWELPEARLVQRIRTRTERAYAMAFLPNGLLAVAGGRPGQEGDLRVYDLSVPAEPTDGVARLDGVRDPRVMVAHLFDTDDCILTLAVSPDGKSLAAGGCDRVTRVWDIGAGVKDAKLKTTIETHADWVLHCVWSPDGRHLLTAGRDKTAKIFDLAKNEPLGSFPDHEAVVNAVAIRGDGKVGASVGADKTLRLWKFDGEVKQQKAAGGHSAEVVRLVAHPTQPQFVTAAADKTLRIWRDDGTPVRTITGLPDVPFALAVSADGKKIAAGGYGGGVVLADWPGGETVSFVAAPGWKRK